MKTPKHPAKRVADIEESQGRHTHLQPDESSPCESRHLRPDLLISVRTGFGNDLHRLVVGRRLILDGVRIPFTKGPAGHSDGDALVHAICDALLGAAGLGDIGRHFPNTSPKWRGVSSLIFLRHVRDLLRGAGYAIVNVDSTVGLERPKLSSYIPRMQVKLAQALGLNAGQVSVKAKTGEGVDALGRGEAVRADAVALIVEKSKVKKSKR